MTAALEGVSGQRHAPAALYPRERPGTHFTGGWVGPRAGLDGRKNLVPTGIRSRTIQPVAQSLYRLSYLTPKKRKYRIKIPVESMFYTHHQLCRIQRWVLKEKFVWWLAVWNLETFYFIVTKIIRKSVSGWRLQTILSPARNRTLTVTSQSLILSSKF